MSVDTSIWYENLPDKWISKKLKYIVNLRNEKIVGGEIQNYIGLENIESKTGKFLPSINSEINIEGISNQFYKGDILFGKLRPYLAKCIEAEFDGVGTTELLALKGNTKLILSKYLKFMMLSPKFIDYINSSTYGTKMPRASWDFIGNIEVPLPSINHQQIIIDFITSKVSSVDKLLLQKKHLINLLEQQRQSIITEAVTKGLNPNVKMKDSGVEWIGEIPEHWEVKKVKHFATHVGSGKTPSGGSEVYLDEGVPFLRSLNVHFDGIRFKDLVFISEETNTEMKSSQVKPLDILLNITGASIGRTALVPKDFGRANVNQHVCIIRLNQNKVYPYYFNIIMSSDVINQQIWFSQNGSSREGLNFVQVKELTFAIPPTLEEQREINEWIFNKQKGIFEIIESIKKQIEKLKEYRQALIYEAVTGKMDVREMEID